jgi:hypothetical protein
MRAALFTQLTPVGGLCRLCSEVNRIKGARPERSAELLQSTLPDELDRKRKVVVDRIPEQFVKPSGGLISTGAAPLPNGFAHHFGGSTRNYLPTVAAVDSEILVGR